MPASDGSCDNAEGPRDRLALEVRLPEPLVDPAEEAAARLAGWVADVMKESAYA